MNRRAMGELMYVSSCARFACSPSSLGIPRGLPVQRMRCTLRRGIVLIQHPTAGREHAALIFAEQLAILQWNLLHRGASYLNMRPRCDGVCRMRHTDFPQGKSRADASMQGVRSRRQRMPSA